MTGEALFWERLNGARARCLLCPHLCVIAEGEEGLCRVRGVRSGSLVSHVYGRAATVISDEIEKKPLFHFHPGTRALSLGTFGCNVLCSGCQNWQISHAGTGPELGRVAKLTPKRALAMASRYRLAGIAWTYNDPIVWAEYVHDVAVVFKQAGLYTALITSGYVSEDALDYLGPWMDAFKFDLKAPDSAGWRWLTKVGDPTPAMAAAVRAREVHGCHVEVVSNIVPGLNDSDDQLEAMASWVLQHLGPKTAWHVTRFLPSFELSYLTATPIKTLEKAVAIGRAVGLQFVYIGNVPGHPDRHTICPGCGRTAVRRGPLGAEEIWVKDGCCTACGEDLQIVQGTAV